MRRRSPARWGKTAFVSMLFTNCLLAAILSCCTSKQHSIGSRTVAFSWAVPENLRGAELRDFSYLRDEGKFVGSCSDDIWLLADEVGLNFVVLSETERLQRLFLPLDPMVDLGFPLPLQLGLDILEAKWGQMILWSRTFMVAGAYPSMKHYLYREFVTFRNLPPIGCEYEETLEKVLPFECADCSLSDICEYLATVAKVPCRPSDSIGHSDRWKFLKYRAFTNRTGKLVDILATIAVTSGCVWRFDGEGLVLEDTQSGK